MTSNRHWWSGLIRPEDLTETVPVVVGPYTCFISHSSPRSQEHAQRRHTAQKSSWQNNVCAVHVVSLSMFMYIMCVFVCLRVKCVHSDNFVRAFAVCSNQVERNVAL